MPPPLKAPWSRSFGYDAFGNRSITVRTDLTSPPNIKSFRASTNRLTSPDVYVAAGNMTTDTVARQMSYDAENRMTVFDDVFAMSVNDRSFAYDGEGRRVRKSTSALYFSE